MKIALAQINPTVGALDENNMRIRSAITEAQSKGADLIVFPELAVTGYPPLDLLEYNSFIDENLNSLKKIARAAFNITVIVGYVDRDPTPRKPILFNAAAVCRNGTVTDTVYKTLLPTYDVFDEARYFTPAPRTTGIIDINGSKIALTICEDIWNTGLVQHAPSIHYTIDPVAQVMQYKPDMLINIAASPYSIDKPYTRLRMMAAIARKHQTPLLYVNQVGGNDQLIFDGMSKAFTAHGDCSATAKQFQEDILILETDTLDTSTAASAHQQHSITETDTLDTSTAASAHQQHSITETDTLGTSTAASAHQQHSITETDTLGTSTAASAHQQHSITETDTLGTSTAASACPPEEEIFNALTLGVHDYMKKCGFTKAVIGLSGGIDSSLVAAIAVSALGRDTVTGLLMPSRFSSQSSLDDAHALAQNLGITTHTMNIDHLFELFLQTTAPLFSGMPEDTTEENLQARIRGTLLMAFSNKFNALVLTTGNKSELSVGYCTLYGDMAGGLAVISDVPKTMVYTLAKYVNSPAYADVPCIPKNVLTKPPSAELRPDQTDQDSLPPYSTLDTIITQYIEKFKSADEIAAFNPQLPQSVLSDIIKKIHYSEYKRYQAAPGLKISGKAFGLGRRMPIAQKWQ